MRAMNTYFVVLRKPNVNGQRFCYVLARNAEFALTAAVREYPRCGAVGVEPMSAAV